MDRILSILLVNNFLQFEKKNPTLKFDEKVKRTQDSVANVIYLFVIVPLLLWIITFAILLLGEKFLINKWIGSFCFIGISLPFYFCMRRKIKSINFYEDNRLNIRYAIKSHYYYMIIIVLLFFFMATLVLSVYAIKKHNFG